VATIVGDENTSVRDWVVDAWGERSAIVFGTWRKPRPPRVTHRLIWHKAGRHPGVSPHPWFPNDEEIYLLGAGWVGAPPRGSVITTTEQRSLAPQLVGHPTPKPVGLMETLIERCPPGTIADPFAGSGSTLVAARNLGRRAIGVEIEERYCETIAKRLAQGVLL
jgi:site-specific DNA-methyltransferase (adenine-specific)